MQSLHLNPTLDLLAARPLKEAFLAARGQPLSVDASQVQRLGGQCLQVLLAARAQWREDALPFEITQPSAAFFEQTRILGAVTALGLQCEGATA